MTFEEFKGILCDNELGDVLKDRSYNEDYAHDISLTVKEIRELARLIHEFEKLKKFVETVRNNTHLKLLTMR